MTNAEDTILGKAEELEKTETSVEQQAENESQNIAEEPATEVPAEVPATPETGEAPAEEAAVETVPAEKPAQETATGEVAEKAPQTEEPHKLATKKDILRRMNELIQSGANISRMEAENLKQSFYKIQNAEVEKAKEAFIAKGGKEEDFKPLPNPQEGTFKELMNIIKEKRNEQLAEEEKQKEMNLQVKLSIIEELKDLIASPEDPNKNYAEFKRLQQQWNEVKLIPQSKANELWRNYQLNVEKFYDLLKLNNEYRDMDFKKNLEIKTHLCEAAERLADEPDAISAFHQLQKLHQEFRSTGPVAKNLRDEVWGRFKAASAVVNRRHQKFFEDMKKNEQKNLDEKTVICEIVESTNYDELKNFSSWNNKTKEIIALQKRWRTIGYAPQKVNAKIFDRFRKACDEFFRRKSEFFKSSRDSMAINLEKKRALCEQAEALKDSTAWKETSEKLSKLQQEWKTIGPVARRQADAIWKRFISACDYFFEQRKANTSSLRSNERENLEKRKTIIEQLNAIASETSDEQTAQKIKDLVDEWNQTGRVPIKEKDSIYNQFQVAINKLMDKINLAEVEDKFGKFRNFISNVQESGQQALYREREKLVRNFENLKSELATYENNLGFLTASSKKGNSLLTELNRKVDKLKQDIQAAKDKIKAIDDSLKTKEEE